MSLYELSDAVEPRNGVTWLEVRVNPGMDRVAVPSGFDEWRGCILAELSRPARNGEANKQLVSEIKKYFDAEARIVNGEKSRSKTVEIDIECDLVLSEIKSLV